MISVVSGAISLVCFVGTVSTILDGGTIQAIDALVGGIVLGTASGRGRYQLPEGEEN